MNTIGVNIIEASVSSSVSFAIATQNAIKGKIVLASCHAAIPSLLWTKGLIFKSMRLSVDGDRFSVTGLVKKRAFVGVWIGSDGFDANFVSGLCRMLDLMIKNKLKLAASG